MAQPLEPQFARSLSTEPPPGALEQAKDEGTAASQHKPTAEVPPAKQPFKPWPTTEAPLTQSQRDHPAAAPPTEDWVEPAAFLMSPYGGPNLDGYFPPADAGAEASAQTFEGYPPMVARGNYDWNDTTSAQEQEAGMDLADSSPLFPGRRPLYKRSAPPPTAEEQLGTVITFLQNLQRNVRNVAPETDAPSTTALGASLLQLRRLSRTGVAPDHFEIGVLPKPPKIEAAPPIAVDAPSAVETKSELAAALPSPEPVRPQRRHGVWLAFTGILCFATLALVAYLWWRIVPVLPFNAASRNPAAHATPGPKPEQEISEEALNFANLTLEATHRGDFKSASDILSKAEKQGVVLPGLYYQSALLALNQGRREEADNYLERSIVANEAVSDCWYLRANSIFYAEGPAQAAEAFAQAVAASPFSPRPYFFRAECLRRNGNGVAAVGQFQQALRCRPSSSDTELILFKIGLTKIEANSDLIFKTELRDRLSHEPVSGDTLLLAAADAISHGEFPEAANFLRRAALILPPRTFQSRIRDYVFQAQSKQADIAAVLKSTPPAGTPNNQPTQPSGRVLVDPATRSMAEADPGGW